MHKQLAVGGEEKKNNKNSELLGPGRHGGAQKTQGYRSHRSSQDRPS
jgi:hypothetical protein